MVKLSFALAGTLALGTLLGGCTTTAILATTGAAGAGTVAVDQRTFGTMVEDEGIEWKVRGAVNNAGLKEDDRNNVKVTSFNRVVLLTGQVPDEEAKRRAAEVAGQVHQVRGVHNELVLRAPTALSRRSLDAAVTGNVKVAMAASSDLEPFLNLNIKVVTEDAVVYLMGLVTREQAEAATSVARSVAGVRQIVRLFEYPETGK